ncbi:TonB-dependent receptor [Colwellia sp. 6_MG-2023]|uniref:TonB-dependent receptor n=1 Tax=Colwellia sp. 6_MG-2023 TaxID=3062676 RepID=UPI0026E2D973|nr:TonB-dependent receptor [Colwellia sp. 6_MG-2023]MDO6487548.1 TonB-dependent receptor [Colwellia sp. 6_MG-2023]
MNKSKSLVKNKLSLGVSIALIPLIFTANQTAYAVEKVAETDADKTQEIEVIEVSGFRSSTTKQLNNKRFGKNVSDSIFAEDIGKMPDANIAEAMQRITGIGIDRVDGEGTSITIRGVEGGLNNVQMNGVTMTNSGDDNEIDFSSMSADMLKSIEVIKTPSANHDEGSLGGTVKLNTWKPLDIKEPKTIFSAKTKYNDLSDETDLQFGLSFGKNFSDNFGMTGSLNYDKTNTRQDRLTNYRWEYRNIADATSLQTGEILDPDGNTRSFEPLGNERNLSLIETERLSASASFQYSFDDDTTIWLDATHSEKDKTKLQYNNRILNTREYAVIDEEAHSAVVSGSSASRSNSVTYEQPNESSTTTLGLNYQQVFADGAWTIDAKLGWSGSTSYNPINNRRIIFNSNARTEAGELSWIDENGNILLSPNFSFGDEERGYLTTDNLRPSAVTYLTRDNTDDAYSFQVDLEGDVDFGPIVNVAMGVKVVDREKTNNSVIYQAVGDGINADGVSLNTITLTDYALEFPVDDFLTRVIGTESNGWPVPDFDAIYGSFLPDPESIIPFEDEAPETTTFESYAGYVMADFEFFGGRLLGDFGVRVVKTKANAKGRAGYNFTNYDPVGGEDADGNLIGAFNAGAFNIDDSTFGDIEYNNVLPSFNSRYTLTEDMLLRFSVAKVMARPKASDLVPGYLIMSRNGTNEPTAVGGNPNLEPVEAITYDFSWEWYFDETGMISTAFFYKDFQSLAYDKIEGVLHSCPEASIFPEDQQQYRDLHCGQIADEIATTTPVNGEGGKSYGVETIYQQDFVFLPGWLKYTGITTNYTYTDSEANYVDPTQESETAELLEGFPMRNTSKHTFNSSLYWENEGLSVRLAYNYRSKRLDSPNDYDGAIWTDDRATVDFSTSYKVNKNLSFNFSATNLTDTYDRSFVTRLQEDEANGLFSEGNALDGNAPEWRTYVLGHNGRNFRLGVTYKL